MQLYRYIRALIQEGSLAHGGKLPSIRALMRELQISKTTVETAYHMLLEEGYVQSKERSGLTVLNPQPGQAPNPPGKRFNDERVHTALAQASIGESDKEALVDFSLLTIDGDSFPIRQWKSILGEALSNHSQSVHQYGEAYGELPLRESLAAYLRHSRGVMCAPEQIIVGTGFSSSLHLLSRLLGENCRVGIEEPSIAQVRHMFNQHRFQIVPFSVEALETGRLDTDKLQILYATPSHRPAGEPMPYGLRRQLLQWAYENKGYIIEDDYDGELRLSGKPIPSLQGLDAHGAVIYIGSFSKVFTPAVRMNYMVLPSDLLEKLHTLKPLVSSPSRIEQWAMELFISRGHWYRHLRRMRKVYRLKQDVLVQLLRSEMPESVRIEVSSSGLHLELTVETEVDAAALIELARQAGVLVYGSQDSGVDATGKEARIYLGFGGIKVNEMEQGIRLLKHAWSTVLGGR
ncbi:PLP-dependent aminotransferase family protein [Paenibacillus sp. R14(2021)]|uniref:MocR-like pyridoxine biosynthesis transcription factor PdxR n=1 Tax=Paenibacillus sp. R14(2021) TaxID=2859228 RepID=UPI001C61214E|nr:PLP-dependent aminotransferase family protein [Paenibacillus sp. R14(2021)]